MAFKGVSSFYRHGITDTVAYNLATWIDYSLLEADAYTNIDFGADVSGYTRLERSYDPSLGGAGRVYEGIGPGWVWESGEALTGKAEPPIVASGIYAGTTFYPTATTVGEFAHYIDYRNGRVVFNTAVTGSPLIACRYAIKDISVQTTSAADWRIVDGAVRRFSGISENQPSGLASFLKENRVWLPAVFVHVRGHDNNQGLQLGGGEIATFNVDYYVFDESDIWHKRLADILNIQVATTLQIYNINTAPNPLSISGTITSDAEIYPDLAAVDSDYRLTCAKIITSENTNSTIRNDLYTSTVKQEIEVFRYLGNFS